jgi:hypothetical protein
MEPMPLAEWFTLLFHLLLIGAGIGAVLGVGGALMFWFMGWKTPAFIQPAEDYIVGRRRDRSN